MYCPPGLSGAPPLTVCSQFAVAYFVMLLAMYYNGYIIICICTYFYSSGSPPESMLCQMLQHHSTPFDYHAKFTAQSSAHISATSSSAGRVSTSAAEAPIACRRTLQCAVGESQRMRRPVIGCGQRVGVDPTEYCSLSTWSLGM